MPTLSAYWDPSDKSGRMLRNSGYKGFRAITPRWSVVSDDVLLEGKPRMVRPGEREDDPAAAERLPGRGIQKAIDPPCRRRQALQFQSGLTTVPGGVNYARYLSQRCAQHLRHPARHRGHRAEDPERLGEY